MKIKDIIEVEIINYGSQGEGVAKYLDYTVFVPFVCVGDVVSVLITYIKGNVIYARVIKLINASSDRVTPQCPVFTKCGGCQLQQLSYDKQLEFKNKLIRNNLNKIAMLEVDVKEVIASPNKYNYRNKLSLPIGITDNKIVLGFYKTDSHDIVPIESCPLQYQWTDKLISIIKQYVQTYNVSVYDEVTKKGLLRQVVARFLDEQIAVTLVINGDSLPNYKQLADMLSKEFINFGLFININKSTGNVILNGVSKHICANKHIDTTISQVRVQLAPDSFFQVNNEIRDMIYSDVISNLANNKAEIVFDVFSGIGLLSAIIAKNNFDVVAIEINQQAVIDADEIAKLNNITDKLTNICGDANLELIKLVDKYKGKNISMIVDPPRKGLGNEIIQTIIKTLPNQIIYISCDSATLARDLKQLEEYYQITSIQPYDMFPQTSHVETAVCLHTKHRASTV